MWPLTYVIWVVPQIKLRRPIIKCNYVMPLYNAQALLLRLNGYTWWNNNVTAINVIIKLVASSYKNVKSRYFAKKYATKSLVCYNSPMMQGFRATKPSQARAFIAPKPCITGLYNKQGHLWHRAYKWRKLCLNL